MIKNRTLKLPAKWGNADAVTRTFFSLIAETESSRLKKEQIIFRDERNPNSENAISRKNKISRVNLLSTKLRQPKSPTMGEQPGVMQI